MEGLLSGKNYLAWQQGLQSVVANLLQKPALRKICNKASVTKFTRIIIL